MTILTLDHNCVIDLDDDRQPQASCLRELLRLHEAGKVDIRLTAVSASEKPLGRPHITNIGEFQERMQRLGLGHLELLKPIAYFDVAFYDWSVYGGGELSKLDERIQEILFPELPMTLDEYIVGQDDHAKSKLEKEWRNKKCDVLSMWCHIYYSGDVFVTSDKNFFNNRSSLLKIGAGDILGPCDALQQVSTSL